MEIIGVIVPIILLIFLYKLMFSSFFGSKEQKEKADEQAGCFILTILSIPFLLIGFIFSLFDSEKSDRKPSSRSNDDHSSRSGSSDSQNSFDTSIPKSGEESHAEVLGLGGNRSITNIKSCYKKRMKEYHPDKVANLGPKFRELAETEAKKINAAYDYFRRKNGF